MEKTNFTHRYTEISSDAIKTRLQKMLAFRADVDTNKEDVRFSYGNRKTGMLIPSVSLIPVADCGNCKHCAKGCYDIKHDVIYPSVQKNRAINSAIAHNNIAKYFAQIKEEIRFRAFFRFHIGGDILNSDYFSRMVQLAKDVPSCKILAFTKEYTIVNEYISNNGNLPQNLIIIFSDWKGMKMENPFNLPISSPIWEDGTTGNNVTEKRYICSGFCEECAKTNTKCWNAQKGDTILFEAH